MMIQTSLITIVFALLSFYTEASVVAGILQLILASVLWQLVMVRMGIAVHDAAVLPGLSGREAEELISLRGSL